jgi:hypothetical protein
LSQMVGAVLLARVTTDADLSQAFLEAARDGLAECGPPNSQAAEEGAPRIGTGRERGARAKRSGPSSAGR